MVLDRCFDEEDRRDVSSGDIRRAIASHFRANGTDPLRSKEADRMTIEETSSSEGRDEDRIAERD